MTRWIRIRSGSSRPMTGALRHHRRQCAALAPGLFRQHLLSRRQDRRDPGDAGGHADGRRHHRSCSVSDHGDMLGERGLWFKMSFFEGLGTRAADDFAARTRRPPHGCRAAPVQPRCHADGLRSCRHRMRRWRPGPTAKACCGHGWRGAHEPVLMEYAAEGSYAPLVASARALEIHPLRTRSASAVRSRR
jgi:hypothetical protein